MRGAEAGVARALIAREAQRGKPLRRNRVGERGVEAERVRVEGR